jgi:branched-chain amino acid transport system ATP-binding protein
LADEHPLLSLVGISVRYGGVVALDEISVSVALGEIVGVIGPNGAGKTTLCNCVSGIAKPDGGSISFAGRDIATLPPDRRARLGIARTFQAATLFDSLSVFDNVLVGAEAGGAGDARTAARETLGRLQLDALAGRSPRELSTGYRKRVEIARALAARPKLLLLDEPMAGVSTEEADRIAAMIGALRNDAGLSVLLVEHNLRLVMSLADRVVVLDRGTVVAEGPPDAIRSDAAVRAAYLGEPA